MKGDVHVGGRDIVVDSMVFFYCFRTVVTKLAPGVRGLILYQVEVESNETNGENVVFRYTLGLFIWEL